MGMFDQLYYRGEEYQTKDTPAQLLDNYKIEVDQDSGLPYLWHEEYDSEWVDDGRHLFGGGLLRSNERWVLCDSFDGLIRFYREDKEKGGYKADAWIEYQALFMNGHMIKLTQTRGQEPLTAWYSQGIEDLQLKENK
jgi:hypothetical protein